jgi:hypothetical protein
VLSRKFWLACFAYVVLTVAMFWPLVRGLRAGIPHDVGDPVLNTWILWWDAHAVPFTERWWNGPAYWPLPDFLALSEHLVGLSVLSTPLQWLGAGPQLAYNVVLLLSWPLCAIASYALAWHLTGRHDASFLAGLVFGFNPYRLGQTPHVQVVACWWMPLALLPLHRAIESSTTRRAAGWTALFGIAWLLQALSNGYFFFYFSVVVGLWVLWFGARREKASRALAIVAVWLLATLCMAPIFLHYKTVHEGWHLARDYKVLVSFSANVASFVTASELTRYWPFRPDTRSEQALYPGVVAALLACAGLLGAVLAPGGASRRVKRIIYVLLAIAVIMLASVVTTWVAGKWTLHLGPLELTGKRTRQPMILAALCLLTCGLLDRRVRRAVRARSPWVFYTTVTLLGFAMCFGPDGRVAGEQVMGLTPYRALMLMPGVENLRVPARFMMVAVLPFAMTVAFAYSWIARRLPRRGAWLAATLSIAAVVADSAPMPLPMHAAAARYSLPASARDTAVVELTPGDVADDDLAAMTRGISHGRPVVNGYTGYFPPPYHMLRDALRERDPDILNGLARFGPLCLVLDRTRAQTKNLRAMTVGLGGVLLGVEGDYSFYRLDRRPAPPSASRAAVPVKDIWTGESGARAKWAADGRLDTYWESVERQRGNEVITIELTDEAHVAGVALTQSLRVGDYPRHLVVETSRDAREWSPGWQGPTAGFAYVAAVTDFSRSRFAIAFEARPAKFVRLRQTGSAATALWSIAEVEVLR